MTFVIVKPLPIVAVVVSRGTGGDNLKTAEPKEVWADTVAGSSATLTLDLGSVQSIDTVLVGSVWPPAAGASWGLSGGVASGTEAVIQATTTLRVPDVVGDAPALSHALWRGAPRSVRYLAISVLQPAGLTPLTVGVPVIGKAFAPSLGQEWGDGAQPIDTGTATALASGGFSVVEGVRKKLYGWTFGDLSRDEHDQLQLIADALGETRPGLVIEDDSATAGLRRRIHYGLFKRWAAPERRNRVQTRWDLQLEEWV